MEYDPNNSLYTPEMFIHLCDVRMTAIRGLRRAIEEEWEELVEARIAARKYLEPSPPPDLE
jgi:hypothetical protein